MTWLIHLIIIGCILAMALSHFAKAIFSAGFILTILIISVIYSLWNFGFWPTQLGLLIFSVITVVVGQYQTKN
jgi:membrane protein implicated in regulation of membrane protease activity